MRRGFTKEGLLNHFQGQEAAALAEGTGMTIIEIKIEIIGEEVVVEVMTNMNVIDLAGETETIVAEAGAVVLVLTILEVEEEAAMMMIGGAAVDQ